MDREAAEKLQAFVYDKPYAFLFADVDDGVLHKNFDRLTIEDAK